MVETITKERIIELLEKGRRFDGRGFLDTREIEIEKGVSKNAEGSARVKIGKTEVLVGVKLGIGVPFPDSQDGILITTAELLPSASERFESGPPSIQAIEMARVVDRGIRESEFIDLSKLKISDELVWSVFLDIYPMNDDGNLIDAAFLGAVTAMKMAVFPKLEGEKIKFGEFTTKKLPIRKETPVAMTFHKIGKFFVIDPVTAEEDSADSRLTIIMTGKNISALQKTGAPLSEEDIGSCLDAAEKIYPKLVKKVE